MLTRLPGVERPRAFFGRALRRFAADRRGATAVEFGLVAVPFLAMTMTVMTIGSQYMTQSFLEHGVSEAARKLRTGEAQKAGLTLADFRKMVCDAAGSLIACDDRLVVHLKSSPTFAGLAPATSCMTNGGLTPAAGVPTDSVRSRAGDASTAVMVSACYEWQLGASLWGSIYGLISPTPVSQGKIVLTAATAFRSEPFE